ncbi:hypothetical protein Mp_1g01970 [Marchantia polymorpha subsp. ruderalis]|uniref:Uncharacterized protein n=2 Tax=Marchantia polymorpha TaxID=3197 RepID=A0AAF6AKJ6_MARPO|nr:hypothetical protein MARPO_0029s0050 [Marchantia polymorpha]BBM96966.1 hypothetical protein Mp_1g01970 [Marchantia polymorpha subsp. ruderalis]|eukprot:PTQ42517.1 hypothetical protein MARPO_0029s0050 [Marchantia polymorpha]
MSFHIRRKHRDGQFAMLAFRPSNLKLGPSNLKLGISRKLDEVIQVRSFLATCCAIHHSTTRMHLQNDSNEMHF